MMEISSVIVFLWLLPVAFQIILPLALLIGHGILRFMKSLGLVNESRLLSPVMR